MIVVHNHPSGDPAPSGQDLALTTELQKAGQLLNIDLMDYVVIARHGFVSMKEAGVAFQ